jgi:hypothetical protein
MLTDLLDALVASRFDDLHMHMLADYFERQATPELTRHAESLRRLVSQQQGEFDLPINQYHGFHSTVERPHRASRYALVNDMLRHLDAYGNSTLLDVGDEVEWDEYYTSYGQSGGYDVAPSGREGRPLAAGRAGLEKKEETQRYKGVIVAIDDMNDDDEQDQSIDTQLSVRITSPPALRGEVVSLGIGELATPSDPNRNSLTNYLWGASQKFKDNPPAVQLPSAERQDHGVMHKSRLNLDPEYLGAIFNKDLQVPAFGDLIDVDGPDVLILHLRLALKDDYSLRFNIVAPWDSVERTRAAKSFMDNHAQRLHVDSFAITATREQYEQVPDAFSSGLKWIEV